MFAIRRNTQDPAYWEEFRVAEEDFDHLSNVLVENEVPLPLDDLAWALMSFRVKREENRISRELSKGTPYLPKNSYEVGEEVVFPLLEYAVGAVVGVRDGRNPEYGDFRAIQVEFSSGNMREFAAELVEHPLNEVQEVVEEDIRSLEELYDEYGPYVRATLSSRLEADSGFIRLGGEWFLRGLLIDINEGHLNLAEAVLDMAGGGPLPTEALLDDLDISKEVKPELAVFSLNYALQEDKRFDEVGPAGEVLWYLRRLEPVEVLDPPYRLKPQAVEYDHRLLDETMFGLERKLDDEWSDLVARPQVEEPVTYILTAPHRRSGTLPLSSTLSRVFPTGRTHRIRFILRDVDTGEEMEGWVVRERRYVYGLKEWYEEHDVPVGAYLEISQADDEPGVVEIERRAQRTRRDWVRVATVVDNRLTFEMSRFPISCEVDDLMVIMMEDLGDLDEVDARVQSENLSVEDVVAELMPELAKLSPQGMVHAATLYSAVNMAVRTPPGPILAALVQTDRFVAMGDNYWAFRSRGFGF